MRLTRGDKLQIFFGNVSFLAGLAFCVSGLLMAVFFGPAVDTASVWFIAQPTEQVAGTITSASPTDFTEDEGEDRIWEINYRFRLAGQLRQGHSYSSSQTVQPGTAIQVEYVKHRPNLSRIAGTSTSPFPLWGLIPIIGVLLSGFHLVRKGTFYCKQVIAIAADVFVVPAICEAVKPNHFKTDEEEKGYIARYVYEFSGCTLEYLCEVNASDLKNFGKHENLALQRGTPTNVMLVTQLPRLIRVRLGISANTVQ